MRRSEDVIREYNMSAMAMPDGAWSHEFANPRMEPASGSGRIRLQFNVWVASETAWVKSHLYLSTTDADKEIGRLHGRARRHAAACKKRKRR